MITTTYYTAYDGTVFDDEEKCLTYEFNLKVEKYKDTALFFDEKGNKLPLDEEGLDKCFWLVARSNDAADFINNAFYESYLPWGKEPPKAGSWAFFEGKWHTFEEFSELVETYKKIKKFLNK